MSRELDRILVVDGSEVSRTVIMRILRDEMPDTEITTCATVQEACVWLERKHFDLVTTALMLPDKDGLVLSRYLRASDHHRYTPIIVVSGDADSRLLREGFAAGVTDYFDKSLGYCALAGFIKNFMQRHCGMVGRILYVEDSQLTATFALRLMERHGLQVTHTTHAEQALQLLQDAAAGEPGELQGFDIVITDFILSGSLTGGDLLHAIRTRLHYSQQELPVLVLTGSDSVERQLEVFRAGGNDFVTKPIVEEVLIARIRSLLLIKQQFEAMERQADSLRRLAVTDSLTRVFNRRYLLDHGEQFVSDRSNHPVAVVLLDVDHFKKINDELGHITGDRVLERLGRTLLETLPENALAVRFGGEEFVILVPCCQDSTAHRCAEDLRRQIAALKPAGVAVTVSIGLASNQHRPAMSLTQLLHHADQALYTAKARGRNAVSI